MAFVFVAIGALMSGAGLYAVISGYSIIQVEEGWASVISGSVLIAGGIITIALALVLRALGQLKDALNPSAQHSAVRSSPSIPAPSISAPVFDPPMAADTASETAFHPVEASAPAVIATTPTEPEPPLVDAPERSPRLSSPDKLAATTSDEAPERLEPKTFVTPKPFAASFTSARKFSFGAKSKSEPKPVTKPEPAVEPEPIVQLGSMTEPATQVDAPRPADDYKLETPSTPEHDIPRSAPADPPREPKAPLSPAADDWLDRAFAELDRDGPPLSPPARPEPPRPVLEPVGGAQPSLRENIQAPEPHGALEPEYAPEPEHAAPDLADEQTLPPPTSAVIGRYESDGTSYVMYADGSIEAHSAAGVYRFASMAELKAFIET